MCSNVRTIAALAVALGLAAGAAQALSPPTHRPQPTVAPAPAGLVDVARAWLASWLSGAGNGRLSAIKGHEGSQIDPNGASAHALNPPPTIPLPGGSISIF